MKKAIAIVLIAAMLLHFLPPGFQRASADVGSAVDPLREILRGEREAAKPRANAEATAFSKPECKLSEFSSAEDEVLLELIDSVPVECIDTWLFGDTHISITDVFSEKNMIYIAESARSRADEYDSTEGRTGLVGKLYVFLYAGYWNYTNYLYGNYYLIRNRILPGTVSALQAFVENQYFYNEGDKHTSMLQNIIQLMTSATLGHIFFFDVAELLSRKRGIRAYIQSDREWDLVSAILELLERATREHSSLFSRIDGYDSAFVESSLIDLVETLVGIGVSDRISEFSYERQFVHLAFSLRQVLYFFSIEERPALLSALKANLRRLVNHWEDKGSDKLYIVVGIVVFLYRRNHTHLTDLMEEFLKKVLPSKYSCGQYVIRSEHDYIQEHKEEVCRTLAYQEELFHSVLDTKKRLAPNVASEYLEIVMMTSVRRFGFVFGYAFTRGGLYRGGDLSDEHNIARAFTQVSERGLSSGSSFYHLLRHEFTHHLDVIYNLFGGGFGEELSEPGNFMLIWREGLAEYLSRENRSSPRANRTLSSIFLDTDSYNVMYSAIRFMFEKHPEDVAEFLDYFYKGDGEGVLNHIASIGTSYDSEFASWLETATANDDPLPRITRKPRPPTGGGTDEPGGGPDDPEEFPSEITLSTDDEREMVFDLSEFNISEGLSDPVYSAVSSDPSIAEVTLNGSVLTITIKRPGQVQITLRVGNRGEDPTEYILQLTIDDGECPRHICRNFYSGWRLALLQQLESKAEAEEESQNNPPRL